MANEITHGGRIVGWLRRTVPADTRQVQFTTREAAEASGYTMTHASSALTALEQSNRYGIIRTKPGHYIYGARADRAGMTEIKEAYMADAYLGQKVLQYMQEHTGVILTINDLVDAIPGSKRTSVANALKDAADNPDIYVTRLQRGTYVYRPPAAQPASAPIPTPAQVFNPGASAGKTHTELRGLTTQPKGVQDVVNGSAKRAPQRAAQAAPASVQTVPSPAVESPFHVYEFSVGDKLTVIATEPLLVRARDGKAYKLVEL